MLFLNFHQQHIQGKFDHYLESDRSHIITKMGARCNDFQISISPGSSLQSVPTETTTFINAKVEIKETPNAWVYKLELPGLKQEEVTVYVDEGNVLRISGKRCIKKEEKWHVVSYSGEFMKRFRLPENTKPLETKACFANGAVTVSVPKEQVIDKPSCSRQIPVINTACTKGCNVVINGLK
ncbi:18.1 kDa class I heat shock protein isoform X1 [Hevea brasiliensis]|uniref:18.1 kDa class I heat shock protein isoform X1 n=1 Tax=Hevea brasiliensis TaxID=3981 RepID=UPI0025D0C05D|nr:18.1 kDa class I heat shock protein isoform X1 [Hevea brasiliensis]